ncbi:hypothetical protein RDI58_012842 [Solanum bulbocastanum]|uniref:FBD domain-containing protein n=1 Tax=Solanum bulbocastanum TaxID=147425 RepID=A0AAN8YH53_SOLBU
MFNLPVDAQFLNLVCLQLEHFSIDCPVGSNSATLILPMLETLKLMCCFNVHSVNLVDATRNHSSELLYYLKAHDQVISEVLRIIRTVRLRKFKGTAIEMYLVEVIIDNSPNLKRMNIKTVQEK